MVEMNGIDDTGSPSSDLSDLLKQAMTMLNSSRLDDAEKQLLKLYQVMQEKPEDNTKILVETLIALSDVCVRRSRMCRSNPLEWQWLCMHAISLLQYTIEVCDSELETEMDNQDSEWYNEKRQAVEFKCRPLEDSFNRALYNCMKHEGRKFMDPFRSFSFPNTPTSPLRGVFPLSSAHNFSIYPSMHSRLVGGSDQKQSVDDMSTGLNWLTKFEKYCNSRIQTKNLGQIITKVFEKKPSRSDDRDDLESVASDVSGSSLDWDHGDLQGIDEVEMDLNGHDSPVKEHSFAFELGSSNLDNEGWDFFLNDRRNCIFQSVVQVASKPKSQEELPNKTLLDVQAEESHFRDKEIVSPLHEHSIKLTLARSYCKLADKLLSEEDYSKAEGLYEQVLNIINEIQDGTAGMLRFNAKVMKNLGTVKSKQGKSSEGLKYLNRALQTYRDLQDEESNFEIAVALLELGNGYVVGKKYDDNVFDDVIIAMTEFFEKDASDTQESTNSSPSKSDPPSPQRTPEEEQNIREAVQCYSEALALLKKFHCDDKQTNVVAMATMRLGDCLFMQKEYDHALERFEEALVLFRSTSTLGRDLLLENAHVMCMLGVSSFMLHIYPKAISVFEPALHLVKYAFGLQSTFIHGLLLSLMGITFYKMKNYHRCVSMCYQAFELFCGMHGSKLPELPKQKFWLVCQVLYVMGNSYNILNLRHKAIKYLTVARTLLMASKCRNRRQFMRVLQILGDCYFAQYDYKAALTFYNEALEYGECESQISFDEIFDPNMASDEMAMHNQLVSKSAEAHISMKQYQNAYHYLEQAHDIQETMGEDIKEDLVSTLLQLGQMHSMAGDVDKAIESFTESLEVYREIHDDKLGPDMCTTLGNLATMFYVKACISDEIDKELEMILAAEQHFQDAMALETNPSVSVKYANFLYSQGNYDDAILYLEEALKIEDLDIYPDMVYGGLEKVTLPDVLQDEVDCQEEVVLPPVCLARYLLVLSHRALGQMKEAEDYLLDLFHEAMDTDISILYSVLGYAMMELMLFDEAAWCFGTALSAEVDYRLALDNFCICVCISVLKTLCRAVENIFQYYKMSYPIIMPAIQYPAIQY